MYFPSLYKSEWRTSTASWAIYTRISLIGEKLEENTDIFIVNLFISTCMILEIYARSTVLKLLLFWAIWPLRNQFFALLNLVKDDWMVRVEDKALKKKKSPQKKNRAKQYTFIFLDVTAFFCVWPSPNRCICSNHIAVLTVGLRIKGGLVRAATQSELTEPDSQSSPPPSPNTYVPVSQLSYTGIFV